MDSLGGVFNGSFKAAFEAHPHYETSAANQFSIQDLAERARKWISDLDAAREIFGVIAGKKVDTRDDLKAKHKAPTDYLMPAVHDAMRSWNLLTGKKVKSAKGIEWFPQLEGESKNDRKGIRPQEDDGVFRSFVFMHVGRAIGARHDHHGH